MYKKLLLLASFISCSLYSHEVIPAYVKYNFPRLTLLSDAQINEICNQEMDENIEELGFLSTQAWVLNFKSKIRLGAALTPQSREIKRDLLQSRLWQCASDIHLSAYAALPVEQRKSIKDEVTQEVRNLVQFYMENPAQRMTIYETMTQGQLPNLNN